MTGELFILWRSNLNRELLEQLEQISDEERIYREKNASVNKEIYTNTESFEIDSAKFLKENRLITVRTHTRFVDFPVHKHNYVEIMYVCQGSITHLIDGKEIIMYPGDILLLNQQVSHGVKRSGLKDIGINFIALSEFFDIPRKMLKEPNMIADFLLNIFRSRQQESHYLLFRLGCQKQIENIVENIIYSLKNESRDEELINQYYMGIIFLYLVNHLETLQENSSKNYKEIAVETALKYIESCYCTANLGKVARDLNISESSLSKIISQTTGKTFQEHLLDSRFQKAQSLLEETDVPVEDIAASVGYENFSFFYRKFKQLYNVTPREYRLQCRKEIENC